MILYSIRGGDELARNRVYRLTVTLANGRKVVAEAAGTNMEAAMAKNVRMINDPELSGSEIVRPRDAFLESELGENPLEFTLEVIGSVGRVRDHTPRVYEVTETAEA